MHLINSLGSLLKGATRWCCSRQDEHNNIIESCHGESAPLLETPIQENRTSRRASLTDAYETFEDSMSSGKILFVLLGGYIVIGIVAYSFVFEKWTIITSAYFSVVTFTTIGYGDLAPSTDGGKLFMIFFALYGIVVIGVFFGFLGSYIIDANEAAVRIAKVGAEKRILRMFSKNQNDDADEDDESESTETLKTMWGITKEIAILESPIIILILLVAIWIGSKEGWTIVQSIYFCVITSTTIGFGDLVPQEDSVRLIFTFFLPLTVAAFGEIIGRIASASIERKARQFDEDFLNRECTLKDLDAMDLDKDNQVSMGEFIGFMLVAMQKVDQQSIDELRKVFYELDRSKDGVLSKKDLIQKTEQYTQQNTENVFNQV